MIASVPALAVGAAYLTVVTILLAALCRSAATYSFDSTVFPRTVVDPRPGTTSGPVGLNSTVGGGGTTGSPAPVVDGGVPATQADSVPGPAPDND